MNKYTLAWMLFAIGIMSLLSCRKAFNNIIEIDVPHTPILAVNFSNNTMSNHIQGNVSETRGITGPSSGTSFLTDAKIYLFEGSLLIDSLQYSSFNYNYLSTQNEWIEGRQYTVKVNHSNFGSVEATDLMPSRTVPFFVVRNKKAKQFVLSELDNVPTYFDEIIIEFTDPANQKNFYTVAVSDTFGFNGIFPYISHDASINADNEDQSISSTDVLRGGLAYMKDNLFDGKNKKLTLYIQSVDIPIKLSFKSLSENSYKYSKSVDLYLSTQGNPFSEPVQIHSNVKNGVGIFGLQYLTYFIL